MVPVQLVSLEQLRDPLRLGRILVLNKHESNTTSERRRRRKRNKVKTAHEVSFLLKDLLLSFQIRLLILQFQGLKMSSFSMAETLVVVVAAARGRGGGEGLPFASSIGICGHVERILLESSNLLKDPHQHSLQLVKLVLGHRGDPLDA